MITQKFSINENIQSIHVIHTLLQDVGMDVPFQLVQFQQLPIFFLERKCERQLSNGEAHLTILVVYWSQLELLQC